VKFEEKLDTSNMIKCAENFRQTLKKALEIESHGQSILHDPEDPDFMYRFARSAVIQIFEVTVESAWKMMQRWVKINADNAIQEKPKRELFRTAHHSGLISDPVVWWEFYSGRNKTSHTYHEHVAEEVYTLAKKFLPSLNDFVKRLEERK